ncbi:hypothetical protein DMB38_20105 [Streptomyces sp. WAC 06738]|nr:hypothetical protein DMB38_20105 [Streptomyces sp. WAC 06738]
MALSPIAHSGQSGVPQQRTLLEPSSISSIQWLANTSKGPSPRILMTMRFSVTLRYMSPPPAAEATLSTSSQPAWWVGPALVFTTRPVMASRRVMAVPSVRPASNPFCSASRAGSERRRP